MPATALPSYSLGEEIANSVTHGIGAVLAIAGLAVLTAFAALNGNSAHVTSCAIFGAAMVLCYMTSTLYHAIPNERARPVMQALDHAAIFLLIAGTYTPFMLVTIGGTTGWAMLTLVWTLAISGIVARLALRGRRHNLIVALYIIIGWTAVLIIEPLIASLSTAGLALLVGGGIAYTVGVIFYKWESLRYGHAVWHGFVLTGSALHYFAILFYVIP